jgi:MazG family protein
LAVLTLAEESLAKLIELVAHLRGPEGCAWDRAQTYDSMKGLLLEEAYEVIDAINERDFEGLEDELGDLLFQVVFFARLAEEERRFAAGDVIERLHTKLVRRHPHVFGETRARTPEEALQSWLAVKEEEARGKKQESRSKEQEARSPEPGEAHVTTEEQPASLLDGIPKALPATLEAYELGVRAAEVGFDWVKVEDLLDKLAEELVELRRELLPPPGGDGPPTVGIRGSRVLATGRSGSQGSRLEEEIGDLLFAASNVARYLGSDPESCLRRANHKFKGRFRTLEQEVARLGKRVRDCGPEELDRLWEALKKQGARSR